MPTVRVPAPMRGLTGGAPTVEVPGASVLDVLTALEVAHPGVADRLLDEHGQLRRFVNVFVGEDDVRFHEGLDTAVAADDVVTIVPAVAGG